MQERFSERARQAMAMANLEAGKLNHDFLAPFHLMLGITDSSACVATAALRALGVDLDEVRRCILSRIEQGEARGSVGRRAQTKEMKSVIALAIEEARKLGHRHVGTEHLVIALAAFSGGIPAHVLADLGVSVDPLRERVLGLLESGDGAGVGGAAASRGDFEWVHQQELAKAFRSPTFWHTLILAVDSANRLGAGEVEPLHLLLALLRDEANGVSDLLADRGVTADWVHDRIAARTGS